MAGSSSACPESRIWAANARQHSLAVHCSSLATHGSILLPETLTELAVAATTHCDQHRHKAPCSSESLYKSLNTHERLFATHRPQLVNPQRLQWLCDQDMSGRQHHLISHLPCEAQNKGRNIKRSDPSFHRQYDRRLDHPSQAALEAQRNLQGSLRPV